MENTTNLEHGHSDEDSFEDAQELHSPKTSAVPITRVEKTDDNPSHGEVPNTAAYNMRKSDAVPDQLEVVPEGSRSRSSSVDKSTSSSPPSSRRASIPKMVVEKVDPKSPSHGEVPGTEAHAMRQADAEPDEVLQAPETSRVPSNGTPTNSVPSSEPEDTQAIVVGNPYQPTEEGGEDFDEFAEADDNDDFGDFDEGAQTADEPAQSVVTSAVESTVPQQRLLNFRDLSSTSEISEACQSFVDEIFPDISATSGGEIPPVSNSFLNERSHSLWSQLVAPPALQPPNWVRSRTRRLFLVSLGVPVDLDEILPASKQKKLVLPSIDIEQERIMSRRESEPTNDTVSKLKQQNTSSTSVNRSSSKSERKRKGPAPPPQFNENDARLLASTTSQALTNLTDEELQLHKQRLDDLKQRASEALQYWLIQRDSAHGDKEAFEEVIQNLVKHAQKIRT